MLFHGTIGPRCAAPYDARVDACVERVRAAARRRRLESPALETIARHPQARSLAPLPRRSQRTATDSTKA
ncbi:MULTISPECIES: hypothetical protein [Burkholderia cepacia complex]|uniref:hypothetical protein n=1 Tax=Burkholderia cepacia complex TaxID=87882 RepID=UPI0009902394|nr:MULTISPECIES: hypothetical protein [Burkholderia cepacia complex]MBR8398805.1 hypothetical protein [Burkholderia cenocepacia]MDN7533391.1 hypothetical protein [Burkholderia orbicola]